MSGFNFRRWGIGLAAVSLVGALIAGASHSRGRHGHWGHHRMDNPEEAREHVEDAAEWMLDHVDASDAQQEKVQAILRESVDEFVDMAQQHHANRDALIKAFTQPTIDRQALESIRRDELQVAEAASNKMVKTLADVAEVLTPEQRRELLERFEDHH